MRLPLCLIAAVLMWLASAPVLRAQPGKPPALMLARDLGTTAVDVPAYFVSEKLDGVRARWDGRALWTRGGNRVTVPPSFVAGWPAEAMDGELWIARGRFQEVSALVRRAPTGADAWRDVRFMLFDLPDDGGPFSARVARMREIGADGLPHLRMIEQRRFDSRAALDAHLRDLVASGAEGLMLHHADARYGAGRSDALLKYKLYDDAEARVVAHLPGKGKYAGMLGALLVERADGRRFRLGSGFSDAERAEPPPLGSWVTYRYNGLTSTGLPRFARFLRVRAEMPP